MRTIQRNILDARRWLCLFLVCAFVLCGIGGIYQRAQAVVGVDDALIGILIAGLAAVGITFVSSGAYASLTDYVGSLLDEYADSRGLTSEGLFTGVQSGANGVGQILINNRFVRLIDAFGNWLKTKFSLTNNAQHAAVVPGTTINGMVSYQLPITFERLDGQFDQSYSIVTGNALAIIVQSSSVTFAPRFVSENPASVQLFTVYSDGTVRAENITNLTYKQDYGMYENGGSSFALSTYSCPYTYYQSNDYTAAMRAGASDPSIETDDVGVNINTGTITLPLDNPDYSEDDGAMIDVAAPWGMTYPDILSKWLPKEWAPGQSGNPAMSYEGESAVGSQVQTGPETAQVSSEPGDYAVPGLQSVFPFCLPFDIYNLLSALAADPVAPSFTWRFYVPGICDESISVDLSPFDSVAQVVRTVELLAFIVGLALVTRERFLRG